MCVFFFYPKIGSTICDVPPQVATSSPASSKEAIMGKCRWGINEDSWNSSLKDETHKTPEKKHVSNSFLVGTYFGKFRWESRFFEKKMNWSKRFLGALDEFSYIPPPPSHPGTFLPRKPKQQPGEVMLGQHSVGGAGATSSVVIPPYWVRGRGVEGVSFSCLVSLLCWIFFMYNNEL